ncbi:L-threonylcarbamoyladenylate synthase [Bdellovibrionota bacterium FG-2]
MTQILPPTPDNIELVAQALGQGQIAAIPTETVYGLASLALHPEALAHIFDTKERPHFDPLIVHIPTLWKSLAALDEANLIDAKALGPLAKKRADLLIHALWPGPFTLVLPKNPMVPDICTSGLPTVALRIPRHPLTQRLLELLGQPLAAPSANRFGRISPTSAQDVMSELNGRIEYILDGGKCEIGVESTVVSIAPDGTPTLLRPGGTPIEAIEAVLGIPLVRHERVSTQAPDSPGMIESHYAPRKPLILLDAPVLELSDLPETLQPGTLHSRIASAKIGLLVASGNKSQAALKLQELCGAPVIARSLCAAEWSAAEASRNLFSQVRFLDEFDVDIIVAEPCPGASAKEGLGFAIMDRLRRAAAPRSSIKTK